MQLPTIPKFRRLSRKHKITAGAVAAVAAAALTVTGIAATAGGSATAAGDPTGYSVSTGDAAKSVGTQPGLASEHPLSGQTEAQKKAAAEAAAKKKAAAEALVKAKEKAAAEAAAKKKAAAEAAAKKKAAAKKRAAAAAAERARERAAANRAAKRAAIKPAPAPTKAAKATPAPVVYPNNLDGWIRHARVVLAEHNIGGASYDGIYRNIIRESSGNPNAINLWDSNAAKGIPSKGLLQVIDPTFQQYHVSGTSWNIYDPVANIAAACNYAWHVYGGMDNVNGPY